MTKASDNAFPSVLITEGTEPAAPAAGKQRVYIDSTTHRLKTTDSSGTDVQYSTTTLATDTLWAAQGDIVVATGNDAAAVLTKGAAGTVPTAGASTLAYAYPPGYQLDYVAVSSGDITVTGTAEGTETTIVTGTSQAYAAEAILIEFFSPRVTLTPDAAGRAVVFDLYDGATILGRIATWIPTFVSGVSASTPIIGKYQLTPTAATHQYIVKAWDNSTNNSTVGAGGGGTGANVAAYLKVTKV